MSTNTASIPASEHSENEKRKGVSEHQKEKKPARPRGFAAMDKEKRKQIAKRGGSSARRNRVDWKDQSVIL